MVDVARYATTLMDLLNADVKVDTNCIQTTDLVQFLPSVKSPDTAILFCNMCFQSFTLINVVVQTWLCAAARPSGFAVIVVTSNLLIPDSSCLWLGINGQPLETHRTDQTYWKKVEVQQLRNLTSDSHWKKLMLNSQFCEPIYPLLLLLFSLAGGHPFYFYSGCHSQFASAIGTIVINKSC